MRFEFGKNGAPSEATYQAFEDWMFDKVFREGGSVPYAESLVPDAEWWWKSRRDLEAAYGPVHWRAPEIHVRTTGLDVRFDLMFPSTLDEVKINLVEDLETDKSATVDGTAELLDEEEG